MRMLTLAEYFARIALIFLSFLLTVKCSTVVCLWNNKTLQLCRSSEFNLVIC